MHTRRERDRNNGSRSIEGKSMDRKPLHEVDQLPPLVVLEGRRREGGGARRRRKEEEGGGGWRKRRRKEEEGARKENIPGGRGTGIMAPVPSRENPWTENLSTRWINFLHWLCWR
jgi:hypothetical protein